MTFQEFKEKYQKIAVQEVPSSTPPNPVVSVLVQTYQQKNFIRECLDSILIQETTFPIEILIGEDGSEDGTREICLEYVQKYPKKIRLFLHHRLNQIKVLGEATSNFNAFYNFYSARGKYIAICEGDDLWGDPLKLEKQVTFLNENYSYSFVFHPFKTINENGSFIKSDGEFSQPRRDLTNEELLKGKYQPLLLTLCFRNVFSKVPEHMPKVLNVDTFLIIYLGKYGAGKILSGIKPGYYRQHTGGIWSQRQKEKKFLSKINTFKFLSLYYQEQRNYELFKYFNIETKNSFKMLSIYYLKKGKIFKFLKHLNLIFKL